MVAARRTRYGGSHGGGSVRRSRLGSRAAKRNRHVDEIEQRCKIGANDYDNDYDYDYDYDHDHDHDKYF